MVAVSHSSVKVVRRCGVPKSRTIHTLVGEGPADVFGVHNGGVANLVRGVVERIFTVDYGEGAQQPYPQPVEGFRRQVSEAFSFLKGTAVCLGPWSVQRFLEHYHDARVRRRYEDARDSLMLSDVVRADSDVRPFVKAEKVNFTAKRDPAPRIISPRDPRYNLAVGLFVKPVEGILYKHLNEMCGGRTVMKGLNALETGQAVLEAWESFEDPVAVSLDAKRFDQHTRGGALSYEQRVYLLYFGGEDRKRFAELLSWQLSSKCVAHTPEAKVSYTMDIRASGDMNTGLGTCLIACSLVHSYCTRVKLRYRLLNNGDDCVVICERREVGKLDGFFDHCKLAGYHMEIEDPVDKLELVSFCHTRPLRFGDGMCKMVRDYPESIGKDLVTVLPLKTPKDWEKWAADVGRCGLAINSGIPILQSLYSSLARAGCGSFGNHPWNRNSGFFRAAVGLESVETPVSDLARVSFWEAWGVTPAQQIAIERFYAAYDFRESWTRAGITNYNISDNEQQYPHLLSHQLYREFLDLRYY